MVNRPMYQPAAGPEKSKEVLKILFLTLFLDLVGFSIIFPLFPAMLEYYQTTAGDSGFIHWTTAALSQLSELLGVRGETRILILFGGVLTFLYSLLQFLAAPLAGWLSDRYGRRPVLIFSVSGMVLSYALWIFAHNFIVLIISRLIGGLMGSNITIASAAVADVTDKKNRSKGMAIIGMAFGLGFIMGPVLGGLSAQWDLAQLLPGIAGLNPFSAPALLALLLCLFNLIQILRRFPETRDMSAPPTTKRGLNPLALLAPSEYPGVTTNNLAYFSFLLCFSGAEFTLTFLAAERLGFSPMQNGLLFVYIGILLAGIQGGYVRRKAASVGEVRMAKHGLILLAAGMLLTAWAPQLSVLLIALLLVAFGSGMIIPCMTALVSLYTPSSDQGRMLGIFRSLGALARTIGPLLACVLYWEFGSGSPWLLGGMALLIPYALFARLKQPTHH